MHLLIVPRAHIKFCSHDDIEKNQHLEKISARNYVDCKFFSACDEPKRTTMAQEFLSQMLDVTSMYHQCYIDETLMKH